MPNRIVIEMAEGMTYARQNYGLEYLAINILIDIVDANKELAVKNGSGFYLGVARAAEDEIGSRFYDEGRLVA